MWVRIKLYPQGKYYHEIVCDKKQEIDYRVIHVYLHIWVLTYAPEYTSLYWRMDVALFENENIPDKRKLQVFGSKMITYEQII